MNMNIQSLMKEAQKMQKKLQKDQEELANNRYEGKSSFLTIILDGNKNVQSVKFDENADFSSDDLDMIADMVLVAFKDAARKVDVDKEAKFGKYGSGISGLM